MATRKHLADIAQHAAQLPFHGELEGKAANLKSMIDLFPRWNVQDADRAWCAAFVYYCCVKAGFAIPYSPDECVTCSLAGCGGWEEFAMGDGRIGYHRDDPAFVPGPGDIVLYDRVFCNEEHDHIGIILETFADHFMAAEGNISDSNSSGIIKRAKDAHIRAFIRIPDGYVYAG